MSDSKLSMVLSANGLSKTSQRQAVFDALSTSEPLSMHELVGKLAGRVDRVSAYRTVAIFEKLGILQRLTHGFKYKLELSDDFNRHHHHLTCTNCGKVIDVKAEAIEGFIASVAQENNFRLISHQIEIQGKCADCSRLSGD